MAIPIDATFVDVPIFNQLVPGEGPKAIRMIADFSAADEFVIDMTLQQEQGVIKAVQTLYIDTSEANEPVTFEAIGTGQLITVLPGTQGYYPFLQRNPPVFNVRSSASAGNKVVFIALNIPMPQGQWASVAP